MNKPYFLWDYDLSEDQVRAIIRSGNETTRNWILARIFESAKFEDVWEYINLNQAVEVFPKLKLKAPIRAAWENAFRSWGYSFT
jgi:hypothetical protein